MYNHAHINLKTGPRMFQFNLNAAERFPEKTDPAKRIKRAMA